MRSGVGGVIRHNAVRHIADELFNCHLTAVFGAEILKDLIMVGVIVRQKPCGDYDFPVRAFVQLLQQIPKPGVVGLSDICTAVHNQEAAVLQRNNVAHSVVARLIIQRHLRQLGFRDFHILLPDR